MDPEAAALLSLSMERRGGEYFNWARLLRHSCVVVLGEAGSRKTREFKAQVDAARARGEAAFFLRLERLVTTSPRAILDPEDVRRYDAWQRSNTLCARFFLDAVDESRLRNHHNFEQALINLTRAVDGTGERLSLVVSSLITGWRAEDEGLMARLFPEAARPVDKDDPWKVLSMPVAVVQMPRCIRGR